MAIAGFAFPAYRFQLDVLVLRSVASPPNFTQLAMTLFVLDFLLGLHFVCIRLKSGLETHPEQSTGAEFAKPICELA